MKKTLSLILLCSVSLPARSNSCVSPGKKLELTKLAVQDSDGLGVCYANAGSLMLQSALGMENSVSYHQLALAHAEANGQWFDGFKMVNPKGKSGDRYAGEAGVVCKSIFAAKKHGICEAQNFRLDVHGGQDPWHRQEKLIMAYGDLMDHMVESAPYMTEQGWRNFSKTLASRIYSKKKDCKKDPKKFITDKVAELLPAHIARRISINKRQLEVYTNELKKASGDQATELQKKIVNTQGWIKDLEAILKLTTEKNVVPGNSDAIEYRLKKQVIAELNRASSDYLGQFSSSQHDSPGIIDGKLPLPKVESPLAILYKTSNSLGAGFAEGVEKHAWDDRQTIELVLQAHRIWSMCSESFDEKMMAEIDMGVMSAKSCEGVKEGVDPLLNSAISEANQIVSVLRANGTADFRAKMNTLLSVAAPSCLKQMNETKKSLANVNCESVITSKLGGSGDPDQKDFTTEKNFDKRLQNTQNWVNENLCAKRPIAVDVCTDFMTAGGIADTRFCEKRVKVGGEDKFANHTMTIVGYEVKSNNEVRYLVQNSWGRACPFGSSLLPTTALHSNCEKDSSGKNTGRFWITSKALLSNSVRLSTITKTK